MEHKEIILPDIDLSHDDGDERWHAAGGEEMSPAYRDDGTVKHYTWNGLAPGFWASYYQTNIKENWEDIVARYEADPGDVYNAWIYVDEHPVFWRLDHGHEDRPGNHVSRLTHEAAWQRGWPEITPHKVNPVTNRIEEDDTLNTKIQWWYEFGPWDMELDGHATLDYELDGGADTYEACVIEIARKIHDNYGNDRQLVDQGESYWQNRVVVK